MPNTIYYGIVNIKGIDPPREVTHAGVLRVLQFEDGSYKADYFKGAVMDGNFEFDSLRPEISASFDEGGSPLKVANKMLDVIPQSGLST